MRYWFIIFFIIHYINVYSQSNIASSDINNMFNHINILSEKEYLGRLPGHEGYNKAADYCANYFKKLKLFTLFPKTYFQEFKTEFNDIHGPLAFSLKLNNEVINYDLGEDYAFRGYTGSGKVENEIVFCGYGLSQLNLGYCDYSSIEVKDKIVMVFKQNPSWRISGNNWEGNTIRYKANLAREKGAKAIIFINTPSSRRTKAIGSMSDGRENHLNDFPMLEISYNVVNDILKDNEYNLDSLQSIIDEMQMPLSFNTNVVAYIEVNASYSPDKFTYNVCGFIPGADSKLKKEYIVIGAHLDHVGYQGSDLYYPGANDNASGVAVLLELANMWKKSGIKPDRTIVFVLFSCEEHGMIGSNYFVDNFVADINTISAMINIDCVGHGDSLMVGGGLSYPKLWQHALNNSYPEYPLSHRTWRGGGADAQPFHEKNIPSLYFAGINAYTYLHMPGDTPKTINKNLLKYTADIVFETSVKAASKNYMKEKNIENEK